MTVRTSLGVYEVRFCEIGACFADFRDGDFLITDGNVAEACARVLPGQDQSLVVSPGEGAKQFSVYEGLVRELARRGMKRSGRIYALGGGVVGDLAGFVAASYMRGVGLVQIPTSLLAMVDSSVGGKVGIDLPEGKNLVGAFWPPKEVRVAMEVLDSLPGRHFVNGTAEIWKYGWIMDQGLLEELESQPLSFEDVRLERVVQRSIALKKEVVEEDEHETTGRRAILNFGHTVGHAIEKELNYEGLLHGEAVAVGMVVEARLAEILGVAARGLTERVGAGLERQGLPTEVPGTLDPDRLLDVMRIDKKAGRDGLAFSLVSLPGECKLHTAVPESAVLEALSGQ